MCCEWMENGVEGVKSPKAMFGSFIDDGKKWSLMKWKRKVRNGVDSYMPFNCLEVYNINGWNGKVYKFYFPLLPFSFYECIFHI